MLGIYLDTLSCIHFPFKENCLGANISQVMASSISKMDDTFQLTEITSNLSRDYGSSRCTLPSNIRQQQRSTTFTVQTSTISRTGSLPSILKGIQKKKLSQQPSEASTPRELKHKASPRNLQSPRFNFPVSPKAGVIDIIKQNVAE